MLKDIQQEILRLKKENDICILAHSYQAHEILEVADYTGDSYALAVKAKTVPNKTVLMCGVRFMAETVKILSPEKRVILSHPEAGCAMADMMDKELIEQVKPMYKDYTVVAYVNTTAALKTICDVCVTSSSAVQIVKNIENKNILFIPDCNLGAYVAACKSGAKIEVSPEIAEQFKANILAVAENELKRTNAEKNPAIPIMSDLLSNADKKANEIVKSREKELGIGQEQKTQHFKPKENKRKPVEMSR